MKNGIHVEAKGDVETINALSAAITSVFMQGNTYHADQETMKHAITVLGQSSGISGTTIHSCSFKGFTIPGED